MDDADEPVVVTPVADSLDGEDELIELGTRRRLPRWLIVAALCVLAAGVATAVSIKQGSHHQAAPTPAPTSAPTPPVHKPLTLREIAVQDLAMAPNGDMFVLGQDPEQLVAVDRDGTLVNRVPAPIGARFVVASPTLDVVWVVAPGSGRSEVFTYQVRASAVQSIGHTAVPATVTAASAIGGRVWLATPRGVYFASVGGEAMRAPGFAGAVTTIAADPSRDRLLAVSARYDLLSVDLHGGVHVVRRMHQILPESIAVTAHSIWVAGFGRVDGSRFGRLDPRTFRLTLVGQHDLQAPQGAQAWAGQSVVWIRFAYSGSIVCYREHGGGAVDAFVNTGGPVASVGGIAYAVRSGHATRLPTTGQCPG